MKKYFVSLKKIVPSEMEYYLEEMAANGMMLKNLGEMGFFYFEFEEDIPQKCKYVVDISSLPKRLYIETLVDKGWEYMGKTGNCYVWRQVYEDKRPEDFVDHACRRNHCLRMGIGFAFMACVCVLLALALVWGCMVEHRYATAVHVPLYLSEAFIQLPMAYYFGWAAKRLLAKAFAK